MLSHSFIHLIHTCVHFKILNNHFTHWVHGEYAGDCYPMQLTSKLVEDKTRLVVLVLQRAEEEEAE